MPKGGKKDQEELENYLKELEIIKDTTLDSFEVAQYCVEAAFEAASEQIITKVIICFKTLI